MHRHSDRYRQRVSFLDGVYYLREKSLKDRKNEDNFKTLQIYPYFCSEQFGGLTVPIVGEKQKI